jgi:hypothetical protein
MGLKGRDVKFHRKTVFQRGKADKPEKTPQEKPYCGLF